MNLLGKIFVVLIVVLSVVFMTLAMMVYATHRNWRDIVENPTTGLKAKLAQSNRDYDTLKNQYNRLESQLKGEAEAALQQVRKLETELASKIELNKAIQIELDQEQLTRREHTEAIHDTQQINQRLADEVADRRDDIRANQQARDTAFAASLKATEELHQAKGQFESTLERNRQLTSQVADYTNIMRSSGIDPNTDPNAVVPRVNGLVSQVKQAAGAQLVELTIGSDDGLKQGNTVEVYRGSKYLGRLEILKTSPDRAVGRVDRRYQQGQILEGDRVATRLQVD